MSVMSPEYAYPLSLLLPVRRLEKSGNNHCRDCGMRIIEHVKWFRGVSAVLYVKKEYAEVLQVVFGVWEVLVAKVGSEMAGASSVPRQVAFVMGETDHKLMVALEMELVELKRVWQASDQMATACCSKVMVRDESPEERVHLRKDKDGFWERMFEDQSW